MGKGRIRFCQGPSCGPRHSGEQWAELQHLAKTKGYDVGEAQCLGGCPVGPNALCDDGAAESRRQQTLLTGLENTGDLERVLNQLEAALHAGKRPRTVVGSPPRFRIQNTHGTPA